MTFHAFDSIRIINESLVCEAVKYEIIVKILR